MKSILVIVVVLAIAVPGQSQVNLLSNNTNLERGFVLNGKGILISNNDSIWITDGSAAGTYKLLNNVRYADSGLVFYNNQMFFTGVTNIGAELWKTDGTVAETRLVKDIVVGSGNSSPSNYLVFNTKIYFTATDGVHGNELWTTDGTDAGTQLLIDINPGTGSGLSLHPSFTLAGNYMYFIANDGAHGEEIWKTDGTAAGTSMVADITPGLQSTSFEWMSFPVLGNQVLFMSANKTESSLTLWKTDGTTDGTIQVRKFIADLYHDYPISQYYKFNNKLYFSNRGEWNLWVTDGKTEGTSLIKEIHTSLFNAITINNKFYFDGWSMTEPGELWVSDGTVTGTTVFNHVFDGDGMGVPDAFILQPFWSNTPLSVQKFFYVVWDASYCQLWIADPSSPARTWKVTDLNQNDYYGGFSYYYTSDGLYFTANNGSGVEPWFTNGTSAGTHSVADINPGLGSSNPIYMFIYNDKLFFNANNGDNTVVNTDLYVLTAKAVLPVSLVQFTATKATDAIHLQWLTQPEDNIDSYIVERSIDGANFKRIGEVKALDNPGASPSYSLNDKEAYTLNQPILYYRLRMVENNGSFKYSNIVKVDLKNAVFSVTFAPNPVNNIVNLTISGVQKGKLLVDITDLSGRMVRQIIKAVDGGVIQFPLDVSGLATGSYILRIINENNTKVQPFIKQ
jgi:ELWxxDGT repeat protein